MTVENGTLQTMVLYQLHMHSRLERPWSETYCFLQSLNCISIMLIHLSTFNSTLFWDQSSYQNKIPLMKLGKKHRILLTWCSIGWLIYSAHALAVWLLCNTPGLYTFGTCIALAWHSSTIDLRSTILHVLCSSICNVVDCSMQLYTQLYMCVWTPVAVAVSCHQAPHKLQR